MLLICPQPSTENSRIRPKSRIHWILRAILIRRVGLQGCSHIYCTHLSASASLFLWISVLGLYQHTVLSGLFNAAFTAPAMLLSRLFAILGPSPCLSVHQPPAGCDSRVFLVFLVAVKQGIVGCPFISTHEDLQTCAFFSLESLGNKFHGSL